MNRSIYKDESGVSEVVGSILTLSITVVLFSSIFGAVSMLETPERSTYVDFEADIEFNTDISRSYINITNKGGHELDTYTSNIYLVLNDVDTTSFSFSDDEIRLSGDNGDEWELKEKLTMEFDSASKVTVDELFTADNIEIVIVNQNTNRVIWRSEVTKGVSVPVIIRNVDIEYDPMHPWINFANQGESIIMQAEVVAPGLSSENITVNATMKPAIADPQDVSVYRLRHVKGNMYERVLNISNKVEDGTYLVKFSAEYNSTIKTKSPVYANLNIGEGAFENPPDLVVGEIEFTPQTPTDKKDVTVTIPIYNNGDFDINSNVTIWDNHSKLKQREKAVPTMDNVSFPAGPAPRMVSATYKIQDASKHTITVEVWNHRGEERFLNVTLVEGEEQEEMDDNNWEDNSNTGDVYVNPRILIVDDVHETGVNEASYMRDALDELDFDYFIYDIEGKNKNGPSPEVLDDYGLTIWMTGSDGSIPNPLTSTGAENDINNLTNYLEDGNQLWLVGRNLDNIDGTFMENYFGVDASTWNPKVMDSPLKTTPPLKNGTYGGFKYPVFSGSQGKILSANNYEPENILRDSTGTGDVMGAGYTWEDDNRTAVSSFMFSSIMGSRMKTNMAQEVISWLANLTSRSGVDVSVSSQSITPQAPMFKDNVVVNATIRNNGLEGQNVTVRMQVDDSFDLQPPNDRENNDPLYVPGGGGTEYITFNWTAQPVGTHNLRVVADPYDSIDESNEENNDITYKNLNISGDQMEVNVRFSTLVVDDDQSDTAMAYSNTTDKLIDVIENLSYEEGLDYDVYYSEPNTGPTVNMMRSYNAVFWVTGESDDTLSPAEVESLINVRGSESYLNTTGANVLFIGEEIIEDMNNSGEDQMLQRMGIDPTGVFDNTITPDELLGVYDHDISHGMEFSMDGSTVTSFSEVSENGTVMFTDENGNKISSAYGDGENKVVLLGVDLFDIEGPMTGNFDEWPAGAVDTSSPRAIEEFIYMVGREFGKTDDRPELRVSNVDIEVNTDNPMLTKSYKIKAVIENIGFESASPLIRFTDGDNYIASRTPTILPSTRTTDEVPSYFDVESGQVTLEVSWTPALAGNRTVSIQVDPEDEISEITNGSIELMEFNNLAQTEKKVYYFWDDMESAEDKWDHSTQLAMINGEQPLEYLSEEYDNVYTDIVSEWNESMSKRYEKTSYYSYSDPSCFRLNETKDESAEETNSVDAGDSLMAVKPQPEPRATETRYMRGNTHTVNTLNSYELGTTQSNIQQDSGDIANNADLYAGIRVYVRDSGGAMNEITTQVSAIAQGSGDGLQSATWTPPTTALNPTDSIVVRVYVDEFTPPTNQRAQYTTEQLGASSLDNNQWTVHYYLTKDKGATKSRFYWGTNTYDSKIEGFQYSTGVNNAPNAPTNPSPADGANGISTSPTLSVDVTDPDGDTMDVSFYDASDDSLIGTDNGVASGGTASVTWSGLNTETTYEWYAVADDGTDTTTSATWTFTTISEGGGDEVVEDAIAYGPNKNKTAVTETLDLSDYESATLSFLQKYKIRDGNGALLEVGYIDGGGSWKWIYMIPSLNTYDGQLNMSYSHFGDRVDDEGTAEDWCWSGTSGSGSFGWEYVKVSVLKYVPETSRDNVRIRFNYTQYENGTGYGWFIDNVGVSAVREDEFVGPDMKDVWRRVNEEDRFGDGDNTAWWNGWDNAGNEEFKPGIDNRLTTKSIDLTNARTANLSAYFKFNIYNQSGAPPDGFRVEITMDNGVTWMPINVGTRTAYGVSGDGTTYGGVNAGNHWTTASGLQRLNVDLSDFSGETIKLRFRVVTSTGAYQHYEDDSYDFGGFYVDDVVVSGESVGGS